MTAANPSPLLLARSTIAGRARSALSALAAVVLLGTALAGCAGEPEADPPPAPQPTSQQPAPEEKPAEEPADPEDESLHVIAMGDMLPHDSVNANADQGDGKWDYGQFFDGIRPQLENADVTFCNQEVPSAGVDFGISGYPTFNAPVEFARDLRESAGCDLVNLATNHTADKGTEGIAATRAAWEQHEPAVVNGANRDAAEQKKLSIFEHEGVKIALVSFAEYSNAPIDGVSLNMMGDDALVSELLGEARKAADVVIVSAHWGTEDSHEVNAAQTAFAKRVADLGADVVIGTGPHVLQPVTWLDREGGGRTLVWYSIGNMLSTQLELAQRTGVIAGFDLVRADDDSIEVQHPTAILTYMHYEWTAEQQAAGDLMARRELSLRPLAQADEQLQAAGFGVTAEQQVEASAKILGSDVEVVAE